MNMEGGKYNTHVSEDPSNGIPVATATPISIGEFGSKGSLHFKTAKRESSRLHDNPRGVAAVVVCWLVFLLLVIILALVPLWSMGMIPTTFCNTRRNTQYVTVVDDNKMTLMLTAEEIPETSDVDAQCKSEYGPTASVADWSYDLLSLSTDQVDEMTAVLGIVQTFNEKFYYVSNGGDKFFGEGNQAYFFENHGGNPPGNLFSDSYDSYKVLIVHDQMADITLGSTLSWYDISGQVLCIQKASSNEASNPPAAPVPALPIVSICQSKDPTFFITNPKALCSECSCVVVGGCLVKETGSTFTCEIDPEHFVDEPTCLGDIGVFCEQYHSAPTTVTFENVGTLMLTLAKIPETSDFDAQCKLEYGTDAHVADWSYDLLSLSTDQVDEMNAVLGIVQTFNKKNYYVSNGGDKFDGNGNRAYFFENHGGNPPGNWSPLPDQLGAITLGSWYGISGQVLCIY